MFKIAINGMLLSGAYSGVEHYIINLCRQLGHIDDDLDITLYVPLWFNSRRVRGKGKVRLKRALISGRVRMVRIAWEQFWFPFKMVGTGYDLVHFPGYIHPFVKGTATVVTVHDTLAVSAPHVCSRANRSYYERFLKTSVERATRVITPTERVKNEVWKLFKKPKAAIDVIPMGTEMGLQSTDADIRTIYNIGAEPFILFVGNIEPKKGLLLLVKGVFAAVTHQKLPHKLVIAGKKCWQSGDLMRLLRELGPQFRDRVIMTGYVPDNHLPALYRNAALFVFPSILEGFGIPPLEAMACNTPVLLSDEPSLKEVYGKTAHFFKNADLKDFREKIEKILENDDLRNRFTSEGEELAKQLSWEHCAQKTILTYKQAIQDFRD